MKRWILGLALCALFVPKPASAALILNYANVDGATLNFDGSGNFSFPNSNTFDFSITSESGGTGTATGLDGNISGTFAIGTVSGAITQTAPVTGSGTVTIFDGSNTFSATLQWIDITTTGAGGGLNELTAAANLTGFTYTGTNTDLLLLKSFLTANDVLSFQFSSPTSLTSLKTAANSTSYSGSITGQATTVPEPASMLLLGTGLVGLGSSVRRRMRKA